MHELRDQLVRANALARLDGILRRISGSEPHPLTSEDAEWLTGILLPFKSSGGVYSLTASQITPPVEATAVIALLREAAAQGATELEATVRSLSELFDSLSAHQGSIDTGVLPTVKLIAERLRRHFLSQDMLRKETLTNFHSLAV